MGKTGAIGIDSVVGEAPGAHDRQGRWMPWVGRVLSAIPILMLAFSASMKFMHSPEVVQFFVGKFGYPEKTLAVIGALELACAILYLVPRTAVLGAILICAYLGGAVATHVRVEDAWFAPVILGAVAWLGLWFRDARVRALLPLRSPR